MSAYKRTDRDGHWWYRRMVKLPDGTRQRIHAPAPVNTKASAEQAERAHVERLLNPPPKAAERASLFTDYAKVFMETYVVAEGNKPSEVQNKQRIIDKHLTPRLGTLRLDAIGREEIDRVKAELLALGRKPKTVNNVLAVLSTLLGYAVETGKLGKRPKMGMYKIRDQAFRFLDFAEYAALLVAAEPEPLWLTAILLGGDAGLRRGEIRAIERRHVREATSAISVEQALWENTMGLPKGGKPRTIPMTNRLRKALKRAKHVRGCYVIPGAHEDGFLTREEMRWNLPRLCRKAGIDEIQWHSLRHTFCSHLAMRGAPVRSIMELAGHEDLATSLRYMHLVKGAKEQAIGLLDGSAAIGDPTTNARSDHR